MHEENTVVAFPRLVTVTGDETGLDVQGNPVREMSQALEAQCKLLEQIAAETRAIQTSVPGTTDLFGAQKSRKLAGTKLQIVSNHIGYWHRSWVDRPDLIAISSDFDVEDKIKQWSQGWKSISIKTQVQDYGTASDELDVSNVGIKGQLDSISQDWAALKNAMESGNKDQLLDAFKKLGRGTLLLAFSIAQTTEKARKSKRKVAEVDDESEEFQVEDESASDDKEFEPSQGAVKRELAKRSRQARCRLPRGTSTSAQVHREIISELLEKKSAEAQLSAEQQDAEEDSEEEV